MKNVFIVLLAMMMTASAFAQMKRERSTINGVPALPSIVSHQGFVADSTGTGINGLFPMSFGFFADSMGGSPVLTQSLSSIAVAKGVFSVYLDVSSIAFTNQYWLETSVNGETLAPRMRLTSSPYSLYSMEADTADYVRFLPPPPDSIRASHIADSATSVAAGNIKGLLHADSSRVSHIADTAQYALAAAGTTHSIGESYDGGIIFWVDPSGQHGLIAAPTDEGNGLGFAWYDGGANPPLINTEPAGIGMLGRYNTQRIFADQRGITDAVSLCVDYNPGGYYSDYQGGGYGDWYLPSYTELQLLYQQNGVVGGFQEGASTPYWSSTEQDTTHAWALDFTSGSYILLQKTSPAKAYARPIRSF